MNLLADAHGRQNEASRKRHVQSTGGPVESDSPSLGRISGSSLLLEDLPIKTSSKIPILSDTYASDSGGAERRCILVGGGVRGTHERVVAMMRAFGRLERVGPSFVLSQVRFPASACEHEASRAMFGQWWW